MIKKISVLLALMALFCVELAFAASAVVTSATGSVQAQTGAAAPRTIRQGDEVAQGDTIITGAASSAVLKFDDGQVAALTANSRMTITAYQYNPATESGNVLLSLVNGGMRAITGLIGRRTPDRVAYRAATATIGVRGTDVTIATAQGNVVVSVTEGSVSFTMNNQTIVIPTGQAVHARPDGTFNRGAAAAVLRELRATAAGAAIADSLGGLAGIQSAINAAAPGTPRAQGPEGGLRTATQATPGTGVPPGGAGGGSASAR